MNPAEIEILNTIHQYPGITYQGILARIVAYETDVKGCCQTFTSLRDRGYLVHSLDSDIVEITEKGENARKEMIS